MAEAEEEEAEEAVDPREAARFKNLPRTLPLIRETPKRRSSWGGKTNPQQKRLNYNKCKTI